MRRIAAGLPPAAEAVWPGVRNDLFVAHQSVYWFASGFAADRRVLDAACGTGYGSFQLAGAGARAVVGVDREPRRIRYARRKYHAANLSFEVQDCTELRFPRGAFDLMVSSNTLEHLSEPARFLAAAAAILSPGGSLLVAVPPVLSSADVAVHAHNRFHAAPLSVRGWADLFHAQGWRSTYFTHHCRRPVDVCSPLPSSLVMADFEFAEAPIAAAYERAPVSAIYLLRRDGASMAALGSRLDSGSTAPRSA